MRNAKSSLIVLSLIIAVSIYWFTRDDDENKVNPYLTRALDRGDIIQTISANGTLTPVVLVNVGTQISGTVVRLHADFNDAVKTGQILAELDPALLRAQLQQSSANLLSAQTQYNIAKESSNAIKDCTNSNSFQRKGSTLSDRNWMRHVRNLRSVRRRLSGIVPI